MRVVVVVAHKEEELSRARKHLGYDRLVAVVPRQPEPALKAALEALPAAQVLRVPEHDVLGCLAALQALFAEHRREHVRAAVDGGTSAMSEAAFLACLSQGVEAHFLLHKPVRLPVLRALPLRQRFPPAQVAVLRALDARMPLAELARRAALPLEQVKDALLALRKERAVRADHEHAEPTDLGRYYQRALAQPAPEG